MKSFAWAAILSGLAGLGVARPAPSPTPVATPAMTISVTDGVTSATEGDQLTYTVLLRNTGPAGSGRLGVRFQPPAGAQLATVDHGGTRDHGVVAWSVEIPAHGDLTLTAGLTVGTLPAEVNGLAGIACVMRGATTVLCATDMNQIAGRPGINAIVGAAPPASGRRVPWLAGAGALAAVAGLVAGGLFLFRRRLARRPLVVGRGRHGRSAEA